MTELMALSRPTLVCLLQSGDEIALPLRVNGVGPVEYHRATITAVEDDEPNRIIRINFYVGSLDHSGSQDAKPGNLMHLLTAVDESRDPVYVAGTDLWKWEGVWVDDPDGGGKVQLIRAVRGPHPEDGHEILALVVEDGQSQRKPVLMDLTGGLFCEWD
ncbi:hypothetical protein QN239_24210 [Mycolicibacterium sp. Y3]